MRIVCVSDTHSRHHVLEIPDGDLLIHAGDMSGRGGAAEISAVNDWLGTLPHRHKVIIAGNHDWLFQLDPARARPLITHATYLEDQLLEIEGLRIWGSPWQPWFLDWAFNLQRGAEIRARWELIPSDIDVLITHGPPMGILDEVYHPGRKNEPVGCEELRVALERIRPRLHVFGHIHEAYGRLTLGETTYVNACTCDLRYRPVNRPVIVDL